MLPCAAAVAVSTAIVEKCHTVERLDPYTSISYALYKRTWPAQQRDLLNVGHARPLDKSRWISVTHSVEHPSITDVSVVCRAVPCRVCRCAVVVRKRWYCGSVHALTHFEMIPTRARVPLLNVCKCAVLPADKQRPCARQVGYSGGDNVQGGLQRQGRQRRP